VLSSISAQDFIHKQYRDPIYGKVLEISKKEIRYRKQTYFDSTEFLIKRREVIKIDYEDGTTKQISKSRWDKFYCPTVYIFGGQVLSINSDSISKDTDEFGIGHKGIFRLPWKGFGITYTAEFGIGTCYYADSIIIDNYPYEVFLSGSFNAGLEYRYSFFSGFGLYAGIQSGYYIMSFYDQSLVFSSSYPTYTLNIGAHIWRVEFGIKYTGGLIKSKTAINQKMAPLPQGDQYDLSRIQMYVGFNF
jgi:hypothetical protein